MRFARFVTSTVREGTPGGTGRPMREQAATAESATRVTHEGTPVTAG